MPNKHTSVKALSKQARGGTGTTYSPLYQQIKSLLLQRLDQGEWRPGERSEEHTSELQSRGHLVCRLLLEKKKKLVVKKILRDRMEVLIHLSGTAMPQSKAYTL